MIPDEHELPCVRRMRIRRTREDLYTELGRILMSDGERIEQIQELERFLIRVTKMYPELMDEAREMLKRARELLKEET